MVPINQEKDVPDAPDGEDWTGDQTPDEMEDEVALRSMRAPRLFPGRVDHVHAVSIWDLMIHTDFDVSFRHRCVLFGVPKIDDCNSVLFSHAKQCAVIMVGGRDIIVESVDVPKKANMTSVVVYRRGAVPPVDCNIDIDGVDYFNVNRYLKWLASQERPYDKRLVLNHRRGLAREGGATQRREGTQEKKRGTHEDCDQSRSRTC